MSDAEDVDEEVYSRIFNSLRHGVRRKILRMLSNDRLSFTSICERLGITSSHLTYHLDALGELVSKGDSEYSLSVFGRAAVNMMSSVEDSPNPSLMMGGERWFKVLSVILLGGLIIISGLYINLSKDFREQGLRLETQSAEFEALSGKYDKLAYLEELFNTSVGWPFTRFQTGYFMVSGYSLEYEHDIAYSPHTLETEFYTVFYSPMDGVKLRMYFTILAEKGVCVPLTLQKGNAFLNESGVFVEERVYMEVEGEYRETMWQSPVIWALNATENRAYEIVLPSKGWYTLCMTGPIRKSSSGGTLLYAAIRGRLVNGTWQQVESARAWVDFQLLRDEETILFIIKKRY